MANEVGTIGQMYENRKSGKIGVLESREEKYKTLLMRDEDGNSFNLTYSTFKSNWRKYSGDKTIETSAQITEKSDELEKAAEHATESLDEVKPIANKSNRKKAMISTSTKIEITRTLEPVVKKAINELSLDLSTFVNVKGGMSVRLGRKTLLEVWPDVSKNPIENIKVRMRKDVWDEVVFDKKVGDVVAEYHELWIMQYGAIVPKDVFELAVSNVLSAVKELYFNEENEEKEEE